MKIIFLDIDGVLCTTRSHAAHLESGLMQHLDPIGCKMLDKICQKTGAKIVISSTWRHHHDRGSMLCILQNAGFALPDFHKDWKTPAKMSATRGEEIKLWLLDHPEVTQYAILDDNSDMLTEQMPFLVLTPTHDGILWQHAEELEALLL